MKDSKQVRTEHKSFTDTYAELSKKFAPVVTEKVEAPKVEENVVEKVLVRKSNAFTALAEKYQMGVKQFARFVEANQHLFDIPTRKKASLANKFQGFKEDKEWDEFFGDEELVDEAVGTALAIGGALGVAAGGAALIPKVKKFANKLKAKNQQKVAPLNQETEVDGNDLQEITTKDTKSGTKFKVRVKMKDSNSSYIRFATREKIAQLRADPKVASVEMTDQGETPEEKGEKKAQAAGGGSPDRKDTKEKSGGHHETPKSGNVAKKRSVTTEALSDWRSDLKEIIGEVEIAEGKKKKGVKNPVCVNPDTDDEKNKYEELDPKKVAESLGAELKGLEIEDANGDLAFEVLDLIKPDPMKGVAEEHPIATQFKSDAKSQIKGALDTISKGKKPDVRGRIKSLVRSTAANVRDNL